MARQAYEGAARKLLLSFDIGTTFSGVSYSIMDPGEVPEIRTVTRFPEQVQSGGDCKIPSILYYDREGNVKAVGAEAMREGIEGIAEDEEWTKVEWFKLHLRPKTGPLSLFDGPAIPELPLKLGVVKVFADYARYLYDCSKRYITETHANGDSLWKSVEKNIDFVFTHPNGWEGAQQALMRDAAVAAGLVVDDGEGRGRISFVSEGEASLHYCIKSGLSTEAIDKGEGLIIVDAGGGTIDVSSYHGQGSNFQELAAAQCQFQGSVFVTSRAKTHITDLLKDSVFAEDVPIIVDRFDKRSKQSFRNDQDPQFIKFGSTRENDPKLGIRLGQLKVPGSVIASFFEPAINCIVNAVQEVCGKVDRRVSTVLLVGGFAASDWLYSQVSLKLRDQGLKVFRPDSHTNKAVSDGGASFYLDHFVGSRISKYAVGLSIRRSYESSRVSHAKRADLVIFDSATGTPELHGAFSQILPRDTVVTETKEYREGFRYMFRKKTDIPAERFNRILQYRGFGEGDIWIDDEPEMFDMMCALRVNLEDMEPIRQTSPHSGLSYFKVAYDIILLFGLTEMKAQVAWKQNGQEKRGPVQILYDL